ncbi:MAG: hypothetical protein ABR588_00575 [Sphingomicrobium sp.]|nr:hypothetical protein [Sphingomonadales bacterium]
MIATILILVAAPASMPFDVFERITAQEAANRVAQCGLAPVTTRYDADLHEDLLTATPVNLATDEQLACADKAASYYTLELPPSAQPRYDAIREARLSAVFKAQARVWLSARGLLNQVPEYRVGITNDALFTRRIESLCGPRARGAFQSKFGFHAVSPDWVKRNLNPPERGGEVLSCLMNVTTVAGFEFGFIGNECYQR